VGLNAAELSFGAPINWLDTVPGPQVWLLLAGTLFCGLLYRGSRSQLRMYSLCHVHYRYSWSGCSGTI